MEYTDEQIEEIVKEAGSDFNAWLFDQQVAPEVGEIEDWFLDRISNLLKTTCTTA